MYNFRHVKRKIIWIILFLQLSAIAAYFYFQGELGNIKKFPPEKVLFIDRINATEAIKLTYHTVYSKIVLPTVSTRQNFIDFNSSLCFINGTDIKSMRRNKSNWKCDCLPQWHGNDCSQPEVVWRALLAYRKPVPMEGPRKYQRRIIYIFEVNKFLQDLTEIRINELKDVVDLFILCEESSNFIQNKLNNIFVKKYHSKILYVKSSINKRLWINLKNNVITNLKEDDIVVTTDFHEIPNKLSLIYFKFYNKWPEPLAFRSRWSVYGFFWLYPKKTIVSGCTATAGYLYENLDDDLAAFSYALANAPNKYFILGDLNHFGGWFCEFCYEPSLIIDFLTVKSTNTPIHWESLNKRTVDSSYIEELIENGLYLDGKTVLLRAYRHRENYYAPQYVEDNSWKYDYLLYNMYSKIDY